jgi:hypothetical protein
MALATDQPGHHARRAFCLSALPEHIQLHGGNDAMDTGRT